jgi:hypothetical protein
MKARRLVPLFAISPLLIAVSALSFAQDGVLLLKDNLPIGEG